MDRVRQLPVGSERVTTDSFSRWPGKRSHMARSWAQAVLLPNQSEARGADRLASRRYSGANFRCCGVLVWAANLILAALDCDLRASQGFRFAPCRLLIAVTRATGNDEHKPLNGVFAPLLATAVGTIIRRGQHSRGRQFSWTNQCEELTAGSARRGGLEFVLTEWLYVGVDLRLVDSGYLVFSARRQSDRRRFKLRHLHGKRAGVVRFSDFALDICRIAARQPLVGHAVTVTNPMHLTALSQNLIFLFSRTAAVLEARNRRCCRSKQARSGHGRRVQTPSPMCR
jgi:replication initiator protein A